MSKMFKPTRAQILQYIDQERAALEARLLKFQQDAKLPDGHANASRLIRRVNRVTGVETLSECDPWLFASVLHASPATKPAVKKGRRPAKLPAWVESVEDEGEGGVWAYYKTGLHSSRLGGGTHCDHEETWTELKLAMAESEHCTCDCEDCVAELSQKD